MPKLFLSYLESANSETGPYLDKEFVVQVSYWLRAQGIDAYCFATSGRSVETWAVEIAKAIKDHDGFVFFQGADKIPDDEIGHGQSKELTAAVSTRVPIALVKHSQAPESPEQSLVERVIEVTEAPNSAAHRCAPRDEGCIPDGESCRMP